MELENTSRSSTPPRVLLADPDSDARQLYRSPLIVDGCDVVEASDGRDALAKALVRKPSIVITETLLPVLDGYALCEVLRLLDVTTRDVPIVVVTADTRPAVQQRAKKAGADVVLLKPASADAVLAEVRRLLLERSRELREHSTTVRANAASQFEKSARLLGRSRRNLKAALSQVHQRVTTTSPPTPAPALRCPSCDVGLRYEWSHIGGGSAQRPEQWDYFVCPNQCGTFQYRQRTKKVRRVSERVDKPLMRFTTSTSRTGCLAGPIAWRDAR